MVKDFLKKFWYTAKIFKSKDTERNETIRISFQIDIASVGFGPETVRASLKLPKADSYEANPNTEEILEFSQQNTTDPLDSTLEIFDLNGENLKQILEILQLPTPSPSVHAPSFTMDDPLTFDLVAKLGIRQVSSFVEIEKKVDEIWVKEPC
ncbi:hypothetical protein L6452_06415 [Arctium lappa]|uniref:Uncharacterized protein n=1 Tax=Arctium lappa TaxID=4217 RepID=A0ACB9EIG5_ARCLA|nr:hypothetical protein L6452_06415 [Arctium lappa]